MTGRRPQAPTSGHHLILFDGQCGLCSRAVQFVLAHDAEAAFSFAALQSPMGRAIVAGSGENRDGLSTLLVVPNFRETHTTLARARAVLFVVDALDHPWWLVWTAAALRRLPIAWLDRLYDVVARHRFRIFGRHETCVVPRPDLRRRFLSEADR
jgi:predicted DCC family thiol-disulfide oxidoreductase YuxK